VSLKGRVEEALYVMERIYNTMFGCVVTDCGTSGEHCKGRIYCDATTTMVLSWPGIARCSSSALLTHNSQLTTAWTPILPKRNRRMSTGRCPLVDLGARWLVAADAQIQGRMGSKGQASGPQEPSQGARHTQSVLRPMVEHQ
jgi:hypothetical protein